MITDQRHFSLDMVTMTQQSPFKRSQSCHARGTALHILHPKPWEVKNRAKHHIFFIQSSIEFYNTHTQGKITFALGIGQHSVPKNCCKHNEKADIMTTGLKFKTLLRHNITVLCYLHQ